VRCTSELTFAIDGGPFDSWVTYIALAGLLFSGVALALMGRSRWERL